MCMYVCMYIYIYIYIHVYTYVHVCDTHRKTHLDLLPVQARGYVCIYKH